MPHGDFIRLFAVHDDRKPRRGHPGGRARASGPEGPRGARAHALRPSESGRSEFHRGHLRPCGDAAVHPRHRGLRRGRGGGAGGAIARAGGCGYTLARHGLLGAAPHRARACAGEGAAANRPRAGCAAARESRDRVAAPAWFSRPRKRRVGGPKRGQLGPRSCSPNPRRASPRMPWVETAPRDSWTCSRRKACMSPTAR
jgi:hypothetical protein